MKAQALLLVILVDVALSSCALMQFRTDERFKASGKSEDEIVNMIYTLDIKKSGDISRMEIVIAIPRNIEGKQEILNINSSEKPVQIKDNGINLYYIYNFEKSNLPSKIKINAQLGLYKSDFKSKERMIIESNDFFTQDCLKAERYLETKNKDLINVAYKLKRDSYEKTVHAIFNYVCAHLKYDTYHPNDNGALWAYKKGFGDCTEYTDLFVTLCRILNIPSRYNEGFTTSGNFFLHNWPEVYFPNIGWVYFDPIYRDNSYNTTYSKLSTNYISISKVRNDNNLNGYHYYCFNYFGSGMVSIDSQIRFY